MSTAGKRYLTADEKKAIASSPKEVTTAQLAEQYNVSISTIHGYRKLKKAVKVQTLKSIPLGKGEMDGVSVTFDNGFVTIRVPSSKREILKPFSNLFGGGI